MKSTLLASACLVLGTTVFAASGSAAEDDDPSYTIEDVTACSADAMKLCRDKLPKIANIEACMKAHYDQLRPKCKARFKR